MAVTSTMLALGTSAPDFKLPDVLSGETRSLGDFEATGLLVMFICNHCPYVKHVQQGLARLGADYEHLTSTLNLAYESRPDGVLFLDETPRPRPCRSARGGVDAVSPRFIGVPSSRLWVRSKDAARCGSRSLHSH